VREWNCSTVAKSSQARQTDDWDHTHEPGEIDNAQTTLKLDPELAPPLEIS
jgi:hypothetical protein